MKSNLEDLYLNIKQCILILLKNYTIWSHNLVLLLLEKRTLLSKIPAVSAHESKSSAAGPNFGRGFIITHLTIVYIKFILPSSLTRCPVAKSWDMTSGGKLLPPVEIEVEVLLEEEVFEEEASDDLPKKDNNNLQYSKQLF